MSIAVSLSFLLISTGVLARENTVFAATISDDERDKINTFLENQPTNGESLNLGETVPVPKTSDYVFPGIQNYEPLILSYGEVNKLTSDKVYQVMHMRGLDYPLFVKIKNWESVEVYTYKTQFGQIHYIKEATLVSQDDYSEIQVENIVVQGNLIIMENYIVDFPIEKDDPRFRVSIRGDVVNVINYGSVYWTLTVPISEEIPYESIVTIDEKLKHGEIVEDSSGNFGQYSGEFEIELSIKGIYSFSFAEDNAPINAKNYKQFTSDVIYNDVRKNVEEVLSLQKSNFSHEWGNATFWLGPNGDIPSQSRNIRVGIDYTHFVSKDGTVLSSPEYGLTDPITIQGYNLIETQTDANGDRTYVYEAVVDTTVTTTVAPTTSSEPSTSTGTTTVAPTTSSEPSTSTSTTTVAPTTSSEPSTSTGTTTVAPTTSSEPSTSTVTTTVAATTSSEPSTSTGTTTVAATTSSEPPTSTVTTTVAATTSSEPSTSTGTTTVEPTTPSDPSNGNTFKDEDTTRDPKDKKKVLPRTGVRQNPYLLFTGLSLLIVLAKMLWKKKY